MAQINSIAKNFQNEVIKNVSILGMLTSNLQVEAKLEDERKCLSRLKLYVPQYCSVNDYTIADLPNISRRHNRLTTRDASTAILWVDRWNASWQRNAQKSFIHCISILNPSHTVDGVQFFFVKPALLLSLTIASFLMQCSDVCPIVRSTTNLQTTSHNECVHLLPLLTQASSRPIQQSSIRVEWSRYTHRKVDIEFTYTKKKINASIRRNWHWKRFNFRFS